MSKLPEHLRLEIINNLEELPLNEEFRTLFMPGAIATAETIWSQSEWCDYNLFVDTVLEQVETQIESLWRGEDE